MTAAILQREGRFLIARRREGGEHGGKWEFPGGKQEAGESAPQCLARELLEELGIRAQVGSFLGSVRQDSGAGLIELMAYRVDSFRGEPVLNDHQELRWVAPGELGGYDLAPADRRLLGIVFTPGE